MDEYKLIRTPSMLNWLTCGLVNTYNYILLHRYGKHLEATCTVRPVDFFVYYTLRLGLVLIFISPFSKFGSRVNGVEHEVSGTKTFATLGALMLGVGAVLSHY